MSVIENHINLLLSAVQKVSVILKRDFYEGNIRVSSKGMGEFYTNCDITSEKIIVKDLINAGYGYNFFTEELCDIVLTHKPVGNNQNFVWIIDPIDGTSNFINHYPFWGISIALASCDNLALNETNEDAVIKSLKNIICGLIYLPMESEGVFSIATEGVFHISEVGEKRRLRNTIALKNSIEYFQNKIILLSSSIYNEHSLLMKKFNKLKLISRISGSVAADLLFLLTGRAAVIMHDRARLCDISAGYSMLKENKFHFISILDGSELTSLAEICENGFIAGNSTIINIIKREVFDIS